MTRRVDPGVLEDLQTVDGVTVMPNAADAAVARAIRAAEAWTPGKL